MWLDTMPRKSQRAKLHVPCETARTPTEELTRHTATLVGFYHPYIWRLVSSWWSFWGPLAVNEKVKDSGWRGQCKIINKQKQKTKHEQQLVVADYLTILYKIFYLIWILKFLWACLCIYRYSVLLHNGELCPFCHNRRYACLHFLKPYKNG